MIYCKYHNKTEPHANFSFSRLGKRYSMCDEAREKVRDRYQGGAEERQKIKQSETLINPQHCNCCNREHSASEFEVKEIIYYASCNKTREKQKYYRDKRKESK